MPRRRWRWITGALAASALISSACIGGAPETSPTATAGTTAAVIATAAPPPAESNELITGAGWECVPGARVADGKLVIAPGASTGSATLNDFRLRLQTREDVAISITLEADSGPGFAGLQFWNSLPPPGDAT